MIFYMVFLFKPKKLVFDSVTISTFGSNLIEFDIENTKVLNLSSSVL